VIVVLATAMQQGPARWRMRRLREEFGMSPQTLERWRVWWREAFAQSPFWKAAKAAFSPPADEASVPRSLLERFGGDELDQLAGLLRFLAPLSTSAEYIPDRRR
jgi:transposase-like protein